MGIYMVGCTFSWRREELKWPSQGGCGSAEKGNAVPEGEQCKKKYRRKNLNVILATMKAQG